MDARLTIDSVPAGASLTVSLNGRSLGIIEKDTEGAFTYWGQRARKSAASARSNRESQKRVYTLQRVSWCPQRASYVPTIEYRFNNDQWRAT